MICPLSYKSGDTGRCLLCVTSEKAFQQYPTLQEIATPSGDMKSKQSDF